MIRKASDFVIPAVVVVVVLELWEQEVLWEDSFAKALHQMVFAL